MTPEQISTAPARGFLRLSAPLMTMAMALALALPVAAGAAELVVRITGLSVDSRSVRAGHLFAALPGTALHGGEFIQYALRQGAAAILTDRVRDPLELLMSPRRYPERLKLPDPPYTASEMNRVMTTTTTSDVRTALPTAIPTPTGPPEAL